MIFEILGKPYGKGRPRFTRNGHTYTPAETTNYENLVRLAYQQAGCEKLEGEIVATIKAVYPIPKSTSKKKRAEMLAVNIRPTVKPDCDNIAKTILDALNKIAYDDDNQVIDLRVIKEYGEVAKVIVELEEVSTND